MSSDKIAAHHTIGVACVTKCTGCCLPLRPSSHYVMIMKNESLAPADLLGLRLPSELRDASGKTLISGSVALPLSGTKAVFHPANGADEASILHHAKTLFLTQGGHVIEISRLLRSGDADDTHYLLTLPPRKKYQQFIRYEDASSDLRIAFEMISTRIERTWQAPSDIVEVKILQESANGASVFKIVALLKRMPKANATGATEIIRELDLSEDFKDEHDAERAMRLGFSVLTEPDARTLANELIAARHAILCEG